MSKYKVLFYHGDIPVYELPDTFLFKNYRGLCRGGNVFVKPGLDPLEQAKTVMHEIKHREFYLKHRVLGVLFGREEILYASLFLYGFLFFLGYYALAFLVALPWWSNVIHEISVYHSEGDGDMARSLLTWLGGPCFMLMIALFLRVVYF